MGWTALADAVGDGMAAIEAVAAAVPARPGPAQILDYARSTPLYDAVKAIEGEYERTTCDPGSFRLTAAAAANAAHDVIATLPCPDAFLDTTYTNIWPAMAWPRTTRVAVGQQAAGASSPAGQRRKLPNPPPPPFIGGTEPGQWRPTPSYLAGPPAAFSPMAVEWLGTVMPYTLTSPEQFRAQPQPALKSGAYRKDYDEVKALGGDVNSERTPEQTAIAYFWTLNLLPFAVEPHPQRDRGGTRRQHR